MKEILNAASSTAKSSAPSPPPSSPKKPASGLINPIRPVYEPGVFRSPRKARQNSRSTHVDGTGRLQTVTREANPRYYALISEFERQTGVPVVLNTSFNDNEPIVCRPEEALDCFLRTQMDALVLGNMLITRP